MPIPENVQKALEDAMSAQDQVTTLQEQEAQTRQAQQQAQAEEDRATSGIAEAQNAAKEKAKVAIAALQDMFGLS